MNARLRALAPWSLTVAEYRSLDRAAPLAAALPVALLTLTLTVLHVARAMPSEASPIDLGRRCFQVFFGLCDLLVLTVGPVVGAWLASPDHGPARRDLLTLAGVSAGAVVRARSLAGLGWLGSILVAVSPIAFVPCFFDGVRLSSIWLGFAALAVGASLSILVGQAVGADAPSPRAALTRGALTGVLLSLSAWHFIGRLLGRSITAALRVGYQGASWWPELATRPSLDAGAHRALLTAPFVLSIMLLWLAYALAVRATSNLPAFHTLNVRVAMFATSFVGADLAARLTQQLCHTRHTLASGATAGILCLTALELALLWAVLGEPLDAPTRRTSARLQALERWLGRTMLPGVGLLLVVAAVQVGGVTRHSVRLIKAISEGPMLAGYAPIYTALHALGLLTFAAGVGALLRTLLPGGGARRTLVAILGVLWLLPRPLRYLMGGAESPWPVARWVLAFSPARTQEIIAWYTHLAVRPSQLRFLHLSARPEVVAAAAAVGAQCLVGLLALATAAWIARRRR